MCLLMGSSECIPYFALHANEEFALSIKLTLSQTEFSHFYYGKTNKQTNKQKKTLQDHQVQPSTSPTVS